MKSIASNGFYVQEIQEEDATAFMKCYKDYPLSPGTNPISYEDRVKQFSMSLQANEVGTLPLSADNGDGLYRVWGLFKADNTLVSVTTHGFFTPGTIALLNVATHPEHRNKGYISAWHAFCSKSIYPHYNITNIISRVEASPTFAGLTAILSSTATAGGDVDAGDHTSTENMRDGTGNLVATKDVQSTTTISTSLANSNASWASITFSIS
jgi:hypothetical protein